MSQLESNDLIYLLNILDHINEVHKYTKDMKSEQDMFDKEDRRSYHSSMMLLANIGENVNKLNEKTKQEFNHIPWRKIISFRNRIVHDYFGVNREKINNKGD